MTWRHRFILVLLALMLADAVPTYGQTTDAATNAESALDQDALEDQFREKLNGAVLVGRFTLRNRPDAAPREERYTIQSVKKIPFTERWLITARVQYSNRDVVVPLTIPVKWAGDTPVISVTDMTIPGLGTYTARVMIYGDQYAGTWSGGTHGGHLFGRIERPGATTQPAE